MWYVDNMLQADGRDFRAPPLPLPEKDFTSAPRRYDGNRVIDREACEILNTVESARCDENPRSHGTQRSRCARTLALPSASSGVIPI